MDTIKEIVETSSKNHIINGFEISKLLLEELKSKIQNNTHNYKLLIVDIEGNDSSTSYINAIMRKCSYVGIEVIREVISKKTSNLYSAADALYYVQKAINKHPNIPIIIPSPINWEYYFPDISQDLVKFNNMRIISYIGDSRYDVDGVTFYNLGKLLAFDHPFHIPATPLAIIKLLYYYDVDIEGKNITIIGRSNLLGKPLAAALLNRNATVTVCSSYTPKDALDNHISNSDIIISCAGSKEYLVTEHNVKPNSVVIDAAYTITNGKVHGDCDFDNIVDKVKLITPVPKGVGPMTIYSLLENIYNYYNFYKH